MKPRRLIRAAILPDRRVGELVVVTERFAVRRLVLDPEMAAARFLALQRVHAHQLRELEEIRDAPCPLERLVELFAGAGNEDVPMKLLAQIRNLAERVLETLPRARHAAIFPHDLAELAVERVRGARALGVEELLRLLP